MAARKYDENGFAISIRKGVKYLLHKDGTKLRLATCREEINSETEAVVLEGQKLSSLPILRLSACTNLKLLKIKQIESIVLSKRINVLTSLEFLIINVSYIYKNLSQYSIASEISNLVNLKQLHIIN